MTWVELVADLAGRVDAVRPAHDRAGAGAAVVGGDLLGPLVRRVHRVRPAHGVVVVGGRGAEVVDPGDHELGGLQLGGAVEVDQLVEAAVQVALGRGAVVADDHVDQRVVEDLELGQRVDQPPDVVVGVLEEPGVDLHLAGQHRPAAPRASPPRPGSGRAGRSARPTPAPPRAPSAGRRSPRAARPSPGRTGRGTSPTTRPARGAARAWRRGRSRRRTACRASAPSAAAPTRSRGRSCPRSGGSPPPGSGRGRPA